MRQVHLMNLIEMYNIVMTSFEKMKFEYLIQVWMDVMKIIRNVKNINVEKILWWRHHLNIPPLAPYVTISHHFRIPLSLSPGDVLFGRPLMLYSFNIWNFERRKIKTKNKNKAMKAFINSRFLAVRHTKCIL